MKVAAAVLVLVLAVCGGAYLFVTADKPATHGSLEQVDLPRLIPVSDFFADTSAEWAHSVSFDGGYIAYLGTEWGKNVVYARCAADPAVVFKVKLEDIHDFHWDSQENSLRVFSANRLWQIDAENPEQENWVDVTPRGFNHWSIIFTPENLNNAATSHLVVASRDRNPELVDLYTVRKDGGGKQLLKKNKGNTLWWLISRDGEPRIRMDRNSDEGVDLFLLSDAEERLFKTIGVDDFFQFVRQFDADQPLLAISNVGRDKIALVEVDIATGDETIVDEHPHVDLNEYWGFEYASGELDLLRYFDGYPELRALSPRGEIAKKLLEELGEHVDVDGLNSSANGRFVMAAVSPDEKSYQHYLLDLEQATSTRIYDFSFSKHKSSLSTTEPLSFKASDGVEVPVLLTLPAGVEPVNLPTIVSIHGGPASHKIWQYDYMNQFLANRGYAVLQVNFRGSTGYGKAFRALGYGNVGSSMQTDITDAAEWLIGQGIADENALVVQGGSYGGYSAALAMSRDAGMFNAGIVESAVTDIVYQMDNNPFSWGLHLNEMQRYFGDHENETDRETMKKRSPITHAANTRDPILLIHGKRDRVVGFEQAEEFERSLVAADKAVESHYLENMGHSYNRWQDRVTRARLFEDFLAEHLGGRSGGRDWAEIAARYF